MKITAPGGASPVIPVALMIIGGYIAWFAIHYFKTDTKWPTDPIKAVLTGKDLPVPTYEGEQQRVGAVAGQVNKFASANSLATGGTGTNAIAADAQKYVGEGYVWGGNAAQPGQWDCSSFVSYVLGHDLGLTLPGGRWGDPGFPPNSHGPTTGSYLLYGGPINRGSVQAGDLVVWSSHIGIAISNSQIISARDPQEGTGVSGIDATTTSLGESVSFRRINASSGGNPLVNKVAS
jgi:cell wall-associated NlpC family hydrolase